MCKFTIHNILIIATIASAYIITLSLAWRTSTLRRRQINKPQKWKSQLQDSSESSESRARMPIQPRIIGGRPAKFGEVPFQVRIEIRGYHACGGVILDHCGLHYIVTAAHCVWEQEDNSTVETIVPYNKIAIIAADLNIFEWSPREQWFGVIDIYPHPDYDPRFVLNDIALLRVNRYMFESVGLEHVDLPGRDWEDPTYCQVSGWGSEVWGGDELDELQLVEVPVIPWHVCKNFTFFWGNFLGPKMFCLGNDKDDGFHGICQGDSGGPAVAYNYTLQKWYLAGVTSSSINQVCGDRWSGSVFTRVTNYMDWILGHAEFWLQTYGTGNPYNNRSLCEK